jgi:DNA-binding NarL/FixJ family response regulator
MNCLIIKEDARQAKLIKEYLLEKEFTKVVVVEDPAMIRGVIISGTFDFTVIDFKFNDDDGFNVSRGIKKLFPQTHTIICLDPGVFKLEYLMRFDISGYISPNHSFVELMNCFSLLTDGYRYICGEIRDKLAAMEAPAETSIGLHNVRLTKKERKILQLLLGGKKTSEIAAELFLSVNTINNHKTKIRNKLQLTSNRDLLFYAMNNAKVIA